MGKVGAGDKTGRVVYQRSQGLRTLVCVLLITFALICLLLIPLSVLIGLLLICETGVVISLLLLLLLGNQLLLL